MRVENAKKFNALIDDLFSRTCISINGFYDMASSHNYNNHEIAQLLKHLLKCKKLIQYGDKLYIKKHLI